MSKGIVVIVVILGCLLLAVANAALWATLDVFDPGRFGDRVAEGLQSDAASEALARAIVARVMEGRPDLPPLAKIPAEEVVTWLLQRPALTFVFKGMAAAGSTVMTTSAQDVIGIDVGQVLENVGDQLVGVVTAIDADAGANAQAAVDAALASAEESPPLTIYESGRFPDLRLLANIVPWVWPLAGLAAIGLFVLAYLTAAARRSALRTIGIGILVTGLLSVFLVPAVRAPVQNAVTNPNMQAVVGEVLKAVTRGLTIQGLILAFIGLTLIIVAAVHRSEEVPEQVSTTTVYQAPPVWDEEPD
jgi:hypothetical protein